MFKKLLLLYTLFFLSKHGWSQNFLVKPYIQNLDSNAVTIMWELDGSGDAFVDWGIDPFSLNQTTESTSETGDGSTLIHSVYLSSLNTDTKYYYQARSSTGTVSYVYNFKTERNRDTEYDLCLVAMSDMQRDGSNPDVFEDLIKDGVIPILDSGNTGLLSELIDGILIPGDLVSTGGNYSHWRNHFFDDADTILPYVPVYPVLGNHEYFGSGRDEFIKYFTLPENGTPSNYEEWWYKDMSNVRIIGMNTNSGGADQNTQLNWLREVLDEACGDPLIDFVFCQFHHPHKSELWTPGESSFSGSIIDSLEAFSELCNKPSVHVFGHTHGYSRGQSRDHNHLWVNVATAGGNIDYWGEFANADYEEFVKSQDEYGFSVFEVEAGADPQFTLKRYSRGDEFTPLNNVVRDEIVIKRFANTPQKPSGIFPANDSINPLCLSLKANLFSGSGDEIHQATQWQISKDSLNWADSLVYNSWKQSENWYNEINTQEGDDLTDELVSVNLGFDRDYYWRVRYRNQYLKWSDWSSYNTMSTKDLSGLTISPDLVVNGGGESGVSSWQGDIESLESNECNSVPVYNGSMMLAVGGICQNEMDYGKAEQIIDVSTYATDIMNGNVYAQLGAYLRDFSGSDLPTIKLEFLDGSDNLISTTNTLSNQTASWQLRSESFNVPVSTAKISVVLEGYRNAGQDNDSYFDDISLVLTLNEACSVYCPQTIALTQDIMDATLSFQAQQSISSDAKISGSSSVIFQALNGMTLDPGFELSVPSTFVTILEGCN